MYTEPYNIFPDLICVNKIMCYGILNGTKQHHFRGYMSITRRIRFRKAYQIDLFIWEWRAKMDLLNVCSVWGNLKVVILL